MRHDELEDQLQDDDMDQSLASKIRVDARDIPELAAADSNGVFSESLSAVNPQYQRFMEQPKP